MSQMKLVYITKYYTCGCVTCMPMQSPRLHREIFPRHPCKICTQLEQQEQERRAAMQQENFHIHYIVDGLPMTITKGKEGYWRGKRYEDGKCINKYFGKTDPRPELEEVV